MSAQKHRRRRLAAVAAGLAMSLALAAPTATATVGAPSQVRDEWLCIGDRNNGGVCVGDVDTAVLAMVQALLDMLSGADMAGAFSL